jgi:beta-mannosidase
MSEYGFRECLPWKQSKSMFSGTYDLSLQNPVIKAHEKHSRGWDIINEYMKRDYKIPTDFVQYNYVSQLLQARGMQIAIEAHRRAKPYNMGTLYWQLNDCWPVFMVIHRLSWKLESIHYQAKEALNQVISVSENDKSYDIYFINDLLEDAKITSKAELIDFKGKVFGCKVQQIM